eukprot:757971-Hanusia_phi.AAC.5
MASCFCFIVEPHDTVFDARPNILVLAAVSSAIAILYSNTTRPVTQRTYHANKIRFLSLFPPPSACQLNFNSHCLHPPPHAPLRAGDPSSHVRANTRTGPP